MSDIAASATKTTGDGGYDDDDGGSGVRERASIWPHVEEHIVDLVEQHRSTIVFANSRRLAERLTARLNEISAERRGETAADDGSPPAEIMAQSGAAKGAPGLLARAHHGSVSKEQRAIIEDELKAGLLPCVVATSSLELGIDMGAVDLVIQVESPPSVASGLQRVGRAGHQVDEVSRGVLFPKHRGDLVQTAVTVERMRSRWQIEALRVPTQPARRPRPTRGECDRAGRLGRRGRCSRWCGGPRRSLTSAPRSAFRRDPRPAGRALPVRRVRRAAPTAGVGPGGRHADRPTRGAAARRDVRRHDPRSRAVRRLPGRQDLRAAGAAEVGELDEEMVYESRVGDVFALGTSSWRIEEITHDRVLVSPAPGQPGRLPFWKGDTLGRPAELGAAVGACSRARDGRRCRHRRRLSSEHGRAAESRRLGRRQPDVRLSRRAAGRHRVGSPRPAARRRAVS